MFAALRLCNALPQRGRLRKSLQHAPPNQPPGNCAVSSVRNPGNSFASNAAMRENSARTHAARRWDLRSRLENSVRTRESNAVISGKMPAKNVRMRGKSEPSNRPIPRAKPHRSAVRSCSNGCAGAI
jgi:hypothetical protein